MSAQTGKPGGRGNGPTEEELRYASPMEATNRLARVGLFVLVGFVSVMLALFLLTDPATFRGRYFLTTTVDNVGGLRKGDPVQMLGVNVGRAHDFELQGDRVQVTLEIEGRWRVPVDSRSRLMELGLLGGKIVDIIPGVSSELLEPDEDIPGVAYTGLMGTAEVLGDHATVIMGRIETLLDEPTIEAVQASAQELKVLLQQVSDLTRSQGEEVARLTATLNRAAEGLEEASSAGPSIARAAARADSTLAQLHQTSVQIDRVTASLGTILARIEAGEGTLGQLATNDTLYHAITAAVESVQQLATDLRENPDRYVKLSIF